MPHLGEYSVCAVVECRCRGPCSLPVSSFPQGNGARKWGKFNFHTRQIVHFLKVCQAISVTTKQLLPWTSQTQNIRIVYRIVVEILRRPGQRVLHKDLTSNEVSFFSLKRSCQQPLTLCSAMYFNRPSDESISPTENMSEVFFLEKRMSGSLSIRSRISQ